MLYVVYLIQTKNKGEVAIFSRIDVHKTQSKNALERLTRDSATLVKGFEVEPPSFLYAREGYLRPHGMGGTAKNLVAYFQSLHLASLVNIDNKAKKAKWTSASSQTRVIAYFEEAPRKSYYLSISQHECFFVCVHMHSRTRTYLSNNPKMNLDTNAPTITHFHKLMSLSQMCNSKIHPLSSRCLARGLPSVSK